MKNNMPTMWDAMNSFQKQFDDMFDVFFYDTPLQQSPFLLEKSGDSKEKHPIHRQPVSHMCETENNILATLEIPGMEKKDIDISFNGNLIQVKAEKEQTKENKDDSSYSIKTYKQRYFKRIPLPNYVDVKKTKANYKNGILKLTIPKQEKLENNSNKIELE